MPGQDLVTIAERLRPRGIKGELSAVPLSDNPERVGRVFVNHVEYEVENAWRHGGYVVFKFRGVDSMTAAEALEGADVAIPREERAALPEGEYYQTDLVGFAVVTRLGEAIGTVQGWREYGGPPLLEVDAGGKELLIPFAKSICVEIDLAGRRIIVDLPEGLLDL
jgi:16S rRNA processing protein RimM